MSKKVKKMKGKELLAKIPYILKRKNDGGELEVESKPGYRLLLETAQRYPEATFVFPKKNLKNEPPKKAALFDVRDGMVLLCSYKDKMTFFVFLPKHYL